MSGFRALRNLALVVTALASIATSPIHIRRGYPAWQVTGEAAHRVGCARLETWISKSGKQGFGASLALRCAGGEAQCRIRVISAKFSDGSYAADASRLPAEITLADADTFAYLPFAFDNESLFNQSLDQTELERGRLALVLDVNGQRHELELEIVQRPAEEHVLEPRSTAPPPPPPSGAPLILAVPGDADAGPP